MAGDLFHPGGVHLGLHEQTRRFTKIFYLLPLRQTSSSFQRGDRYLTYYAEAGSRQQSIELLKAMGPLWKMMDNYFSASFPNLASAQKVIASSSFLFRTPGDTIFQACALNKHPHQVSIHTDDNYGMTAVYVGGHNFVGGKTCFPEVNLAFIMKPHSKLYNYGNLIHYVTEVTEGIRHSCSWYSKKIARETKTFKPLIIPSETEAFTEMLCNTW